MPTIWDEIDNLRKRVEALEREDQVILEGSFVILNSATLENDIKKVNDAIRRSVKRFGRVIVDIPTEN